MGFLILLAGDFLSLSAVYDTRKKDNFHTKFDDFLTEGDFSWKWENFIGLVKRDLLDDIADDNQIETVICQDLFSVLILWQVITEISKN